MKYYIAEKLEKLEKIQREYAFIHVNMDDPSVALFERISTATKKSVINLGKKTVAELMLELNKFPSYETVINEFGDEFHMTEIRNMVKNSYALVNTGYLSGTMALTETVGPIGDIVFPMVKPDGQPTVDGFPPDNLSLGVNSETGAAE